ncbi:MAG: DUF4389 domain-containing protein [Acidimicrobiales bacterium]
MTYPATFAFEPPEKVANWRPLVQWFLAIPHFIVMYLLNIVAGIATIVSWFAIVLTGKLPEGLATFNCMYVRYQTRVMAYVGFLHEEYPPFDFTTTAADRASARSGSTSSPLSTGGTGSPCSFGSSG